MRPLTAGFWIRDDHGDLVGGGEAPLPPVILDGHDAYEAAQRVGQAVELAILAYLAQRGPIDESRAANVDPPAHASEPRGRA